MADWGTEIERDQTTKQAGGSSILFNAEETGAIRSDYIPVIPTRTYHAFASIRDDDTGNAGDKLHLYVEWFTAAKATISTDDVWPDSWPNTIDAWAPVALVADAPATAAYCQLIADKTADGGNGQEMWVDHFEISLFPYAFAAYTNAAQSIAHNTSTRLNFGVEEYDHGTVFVSPTFTAKEAGLYVVSGNTPLIPVTGYNGSTAYLYLYKNGGVGGGGTTYTVDKQTLIAGSAYTMLQCSMHMKLAAGDTLDLYAFHTDNQALTTANGVDTRFAIARFGAK